MAEFVLNGMGDITLKIGGACAVVEIDRKVKQRRIIPLRHVLCVEVSQPYEEHRGYIYIRTPAANKAMKAGVARDFVIDDDIVFFNDDESYAIACAMQDFIAAYIAATDKK